LDLFYLKKEVIVPGPPSLDIEECPRPQDDDRVIAHLDDRLRERYTLTPMCSEWSTEWELEERSTVGNAKD
jgi:hypothetical protein